MDLNSYIKNGLSVRPVAADFMIMELEMRQDNEKYEDEYEGDVYDPSDEVEHSISELKTIHNVSDIDKLRTFLEGKYVFEEGETLSAFDTIDDDRENMIYKSYNYLKSLDDFEHVFYKWSLTDASIWALIH